MRVSGPGESVSGSLWLPGKGRVVEGATSALVWAEGATEAPRRERALSCCHCDTKLPGTPANREFWRTYYSCPVRTVFWPRFRACVCVCLCVFARGDGLAECRVFVGRLGVALFGHSDWTQSACSHSSQPARSKIWGSDLNTHSACHSQGTQDWDQIKCVEMYETHNENTDRLFLPLFKEKGVISSFKQNYWFIFTSILTFMLLKLGDSELELESDLVVGWFEV